MFRSGLRGRVCIPRAETAKREDTLDAALHPLLNIPVVMLR